MNCGVLEVGYLDWFEGGLFEVVCRWWRNWGGLEVAGGVRCLWGHIVYSAWFGCIYVLVCG